MMEMNIFNHRRAYSTPFQYYNQVNNTYRAALYMNWILYPATGVNGYTVVNNYPYYIYNGYRHRYSSFETCNYQLFDKNNHQVIQTFWNNNCANGYNFCANMRDNMNEQLWENRYECAETFRNRQFNFSTPTYEDRSAGCYNFDRLNGICYDEY